MSKKIGVAQALWFGSLLLVASAAAIVHAETFVPLSAERVLGLNASPPDDASRAAVISSLAVDAAGQRVAAVGDDHALRLWSVQDGAKLYDVPLHADWIRAVAIRPDGAVLATAGDDRRVRLWDLATQRCVAEAATLPSALFSVSYSPDGSLLAAVGFDNKIRLLDGRDARLLKSVEGPGADLRVVRFSPDGQLLAVAGRAGMVRLCEVPSGKLLAEMDGGRRRINALAFSPDGRLMACGGESRCVKLFTREGKPAVDFCERSGTVTALAFCGGDRLAIGRSDNSLEVWNLTSQTLVAELGGHTGTIAALGWNDTAKMLVSGSYDTTVRVFRLDRE